MKKIASRKDSRVVDLLMTHGVAGYGIYVLLIEYLGGRKVFRSKSDYKRIAYELHADAETVRSVLEDFGLFDCTDTEYYNLGKAPVSKEFPLLEVEEPTEENKPEKSIVSPAKQELVAPPCPESQMSRSERRRQERLQRKSCHGAA